MRKSQQVVHAERQNRWGDLKPLLPTGSRRRRGKGPRPFSQLAIAQVDPLYPRDENNRRVIPAVLWHDGLTPENARWHKHGTVERLRARPTRGRHSDSAIMAGDPVPVRTMRDSFARLAQRHDHGLDHAGQPTTHTTVGLVRPAPTRVTLVVPIGRESVDRDRVGVSADPAYRTYTRPGHDSWTLARDTHRSLASGLLRPGRPREADKPMLIQQAGEIAFAELAKTHDPDRLPADSVSLCHLYLLSVGKLKGVCHGCTKRLGKREKRWCPDCRADRRRLSRQLSQDD